MSQTEKTRIISLDGMATTVMPDYDGPVTSQEVNEFWSNAMLADCSLVPSYVSATEEDATDE